MKDLCTLSGLPRQAIHFYIEQGLVPEGHKTGRNMAYYGDEHLERIRLVRQLQHERLLPLKAIRAVIDEKGDGFSPVQRRMLADVKQRLGSPVLSGARGRHDTVAVREVMLRAGVDQQDFDGLVELGLFAVSGAKSRRRMARDDAWIVELWGEVRRLGFTRERGFSPDLLGLFEEAISRMFDRETRVLSRLLAHVPAGEVASMVERSLPLIHSFLVRYHEAKVRDFFAAM